MVWFLPLLVSAPVLASDWYVDATNGSNANGGTAASDAWRTITWAVAHTPTSGVQTIHIAPGVYDAALGEQYPVVMRSELQLVGAVVGANRPRLVGPSSVNIVQMLSDAAHPVHFGPQTLLQGLELTGGVDAVWMVNFSQGIDATLRDLVIHDVGNTGILHISWGGQSSQLVLEQIHFDNPPVFPQQGTGLEMSAGNGAHLDLTVRDSEFLTTDRNVYVAGEVEARFERCRIENAAYSNLALRGMPGLNLRAVFNACSMSGGDNWGCQLVPASAGGALSARFERCTVANNGFIGMGIEGSGSAPIVEIEQCVLANPAADLGIPATSIVRSSLVADGQFTGANGNFAADPKFVEPLVADWRLRWGSPCIDRTADASVASELDLAGHARGVDGDLDRVERSDIGAFEFQPLALVSTGQLGSTLELDSWGPQGNASVVYWTRTGPVAPIATPYGQFDLDVTLARVFRTTTVGATTPTQIIRHIPNNPLLAGQTYAFQSLVDSSASPIGKAYTNAVAVTFVP